ncbi:MAG: ROK family protein [Candidatus Dormibacteria bacterium]
MPGDREVVALDLGGTWIRAARFSSRGEIVKRARDRTAARLGPAAVVAQIRSLVDAVGPADQERRVVAIGVPGPVDPFTGVVEGAPNLPGWRSFPLKERVEEALGSPCLVDHDATLAALGEHRQGAGRGFPNFVYVTVSTGIGAGLVLDGRLYRGGQGKAGEFGHIVVDPAGPACHCGNRGCLEALSSGTAIAALAGLGSAAAVSLAAQAGDESAARVLAAAASHLGLAVGGSLINLLNPDAIAFGGGVFAAGPVFWDQMAEGVARGSFQAPREHCRLLRAELGEDQGLVGAFELALDAGPVGTAPAGA